MKLAALLVALVIAGCAHTHTTVGAGAATASGTTGTSASASVHGHGHGLAALVIAGMFIAAAAEYSRDPYPPARFSDFGDWLRGPPPPPEMDAGRRIDEQDCSKPIDQSAGNLRCK